jgi:hypothetical protein
MATPKQNKQPSALPCLHFFFLFFFFFGLLCWCANTRCSATGTQSEPLVLASGCAR